MLIFYHLNLRTLLIMLGKLSKCALQDSIVGMFIFFCEKENEPKEITPVPRPFSLSILRSRLLGRTGAL